MKIAFINSIKNCPQILSAKGFSDNRNYASPVSFGHSEDIFEFGDLESNTLNIDKQQMPHPAEIKASQYFRYTQLEGEINNKLNFSMKIQGRNYEGEYANLPFSLNFEKGAKPQYNFSGKLLSSDLEMHSATLGSKTFIEGKQGHKAIKLRAYDAEDFSHIKGTMGNNRIELVVRNEGEFKEIEGKIDDGKFTYKQSKNGISGGTETINPLLPILIAIADKIEFKPKPVAVEKSYDDKLYKESPGDEYIDRNNFF